MNGIRGRSQPSRCPLIYRSSWKMRAFWLGTEDLCWSEVLSSVHSFLPGPFQKEESYGSGSWPPRACKVSGSLGLSLSSLRWPPPIVEPHGFRWASSVVARGRSCPGGLALPARQL